MPTLRKIMLDGIHWALMKNHWRRGKTAKELGISQRGLSIYINEMKEKGYFIRPSPMGCSRKAHELRNQGKHFVTKPKKVDLSDPDISKKERINALYPN